MGSACRITSSDLENTVTDELPSHVPALLEESTMDGPVSGPTRLLERIRDLDNPVQSMGGRDCAVEIFSPLSEEFDFVAFGRAAPDQLTAENRERWVALLRWLWQGLAAWRASDDPKCGELAALLAVAEYCNFREKEWGAMPESVGENDELMDKLVALHSRFSSSFAAPAGMREPLWEREVVDKFVRADKENDWPTIAELWGVFENTMYINSFQSQLIKCLRRFDFQRLLAAFASVDSFVTVSLSATALTRRDRLNLSAKTANAKARFAAVFSVLRSWSRIETLDEAEQSLLADAFSLVAEEEIEWEKWMGALNRFPGRYPLIQGALGRALAGCPDRRLQAYVDSVHLFPNVASGRDAIGACLHAFAVSASPERRRLMWALSFERWLGWNFGVVEGQHMFQIAQSDFDYAIVAYCLECLDEEATRKQQHALVLDISTAENRWYRSLSDYLTERNRLLSLMQPYAHADNVAQNGGARLSSVRYSIDNPSDRYVKILARTG